MAEITSASFDAANAGFLQLSSDTTRVYFDADLTIDAEGEPTGSTRTDFGGAFSDELPFTLITSALAINTTELNVMRNGTVITTNGAAGFGNSADYTFRTACNVDWDNMNFMCSNGLVNGWGLAGSGSTVRPVGQVVNSTFGTTAMTPGGAPGASDTFSLTRDNNFSSAIPGAGEWAISTVFRGNSREPSRDPADWVGGGINIDTSNTFTNVGDANIGDITTVTIAASGGDVVLTVQNGQIDGSDYDFEITAATGNALTTGEYPGAGTAGSSLDITFAEAGTAGVAGPVGNWFVNLSNVDASFVFANNALDAAVLNTAAAGNYVVGLAFAGTVRQQSNNNNSYTIRINSFARAYEGETNTSPWTLMMNNSFANNATTPYAAGVGNDAIAHYETNNVPGGSTVLMVNEQFEGDAFFAAKRNGTSATFVSTYAWNPTFITPASATIADAKLVGVGSDVIYQVPTGATNRVSEFATQYPTITDGIIVNSSNGFLVQAGSLAISPNNATSLEGTAARSFTDGSLLVTPVTKRAKSYTHLVDTVVTSDINLIENSGGSTGAFSFTTEQATTADVDASLVSAPIATVIAYDGSATFHNSGSALYSRLKADWYSEDGLDESLADFAGTATAGTISSVHNINLSNTVASASVDATSGIVLPASAGITGDSTYSAISTTGTISVGVDCTDMSLTGSTVTITAVTIDGGTLSGLLDIVDGATFSGGVNFDGTLNAFTGTSLDLSNVRFGSSFAVTAGSGAGKTVTVSNDTSTAHQTLLTNAGWTVQLPPTLATLTIRPTVNGRYGVKRVYQGGAVTNFIAPTDFVAGADLDIALTSADEWVDGDYLEVWYKYDSDIATTTIYQEGVFRHNFTGSSPDNVTNGTVAFSAPITTIIVGNVVASGAGIATDSNTAVSNSGTTTQVVQYGVTGAGDEGVRTVNQSQGLAVEIANRDDYFNTWFYRSNTTPLLTLGIAASGAAAEEWNTDAITFASGVTTVSSLLVSGTPTNVTVPRAQGVTNWGTIAGSTGAFSLSRAGSDEVAVTLAGGASLGQVVNAARQGIDTSTTAAKVSDIENVAGWTVDDASLGPLVNQYEQSTDYTGNI